MRTELHSALLIVVMVIGTAGMRFLPFLLFKDEASTPRWIRRLSEALPQAIIGMLVIYCLRTLKLTAAPFGAPALIACAATAALQFWRDNSILSIVGGTALYMILTHFVF
ncbi:MAG: AzlD domain-containing protein [Clostridia bacterium]|nr:AzlD domain-containing protein [Clostridia bacterium]